MESNDEFVIIGFDLIHVEIDVQLTVRNDVQVERGMELEVEVGFIGGKSLVDGS
jgi:hypothetical protein